MHTHGGTTGGTNGGGGTGGITGGGGTIGGTTGGITGGTTIGGTTGGTTIGGVTVGGNVTFVTVGGIGGKNPSAFCVQIVNAATPSTPTGIAVRKMLFHSMTIGSTSDSNRRASVCC